MDWAWPGASPRSLGLSGGSVRVSATVEFRPGPAHSSALGAPSTCGRPGSAILRLLAIPNAMAAVAVLRAFGARGPICLWRGPWAQLPARFCSRDPAGAGRRESEPRPTSARQLNGIRSAPGRAGSSRWDRVGVRAPPLTRGGPGEPEPRLRPWGGNSPCPGPGPGSETRRNIVLSNPKKRNALSLAMLKSLQSDILHDADSNDLKVIIISAEGPVFSSGHDLKELTEEQGRDYHAEVFRTCSKVMMHIRNHPVPVIAMVNGLATAAGCQLVASCDIAVASDKSSFATPGVNIGLFCSTPGVALARAVPRKSLALSPRLEYSGAISAHCNVQGILLPQPP
nr:enoyl-CoA hydratase domain-containing protein 3, mitochondrial isoform X3 [Gorilla gorilla gorilla]